MLSGSDGDNLKDFLNQRIDVSYAKSKGSSKAQAKLNLGNIRKGSDFQEDFLANYEDFSESWREACRKMQRF